MMDNRNYKNLEPLLVYHNYKETNYANIQRHS